VEQGGYNNPQYWSAEGWRWVSQMKITIPKFWIKKTDGQFTLRNVFEETKTMPWDWPVEVNNFEANAYARWLRITTGRNIRLPKEDEYYSMLSYLKFTMRDTANQNIALMYSTSTPVDLKKVGDIYDAMGNVWQWTRTTMYPFNEFQTHPDYDDFTIPTFDD